MSKKVAAIIYGTHLGLERRFAVIWSQYRRQYPDAELDIYCNKKLIKLLREAGFKDLEHLQFKPLYNGFLECCCSMIEWGLSLGSKMSSIPVIGKLFFKAIRVSRAYKLGLISSLSVGKFKHYDKVHYVNTWIWPQKFAKAKQLIFSAVNTQIGDWLPERKGTLNAIRKHGAQLDCFSPDIERQVKEIFPDGEIVTTVAPGSALDPARYQVAEKQDIIAFSGRFDEEKNPLTFVRAVAGVKEKHPHIRAIMLGKGHMEPEIRAEITKYKLENTISLEFVSDPCNKLADVLIYVSLQTTNNYPAQALIEAMGCGCYIVASDVGETHMLVSDTLKTGERVKLNDSDVEESILRALSQREQTIEWGMNARKLAVEKHSPERFASYLHTIYHENE